MPEARMRSSTSRSTASLEAVSGTRSGSSSPAAVAASAIILPLATVLGQEIARSGGRAKTRQTWRGTPNEAAHVTGGESVGHGMTKVTQCRDVLHRRNGVDALATGASGQQNRSTESLPIPSEDAVEPVDNVAQRPDHFLARGGRGVAAEQVVELAASNAAHRGEVSGRQVEPLPQAAHDLSKRRRPVRLGGKHEVADGMEIAAKPHDVNAVLAHVGGRVVG